MIAPRHERGTALLTVLLLVAVMAAVAATALDRITLATRLAGNAVTASQARAWLTTAELLAASRLGDLVTADAAQTTLAGGWMGVERSIALPDGASVRATVGDGGNCFNLNSLVEAHGESQFVIRPRGVEQFTALMTILGVGEGEAVQIAAAMADWIDSDDVAGPAGAEDSAYSGTDIAVLTANRLVADTSELRAVRGVTPAIYDRLSPWLCALPMAELSPLNVNTLLPEQAPLLVMLAPQQLTPALARAQLAGRGQGGYGSVKRFWESSGLAQLNLSPEVTGQVQTQTKWFTLAASVEAGGLTMSETALIDARTAPAMIVSRQYGDVR